MEFDESFQLILKPHYHDRELAFDTNYDTAHNNNQRPTYQVHKFLYVIYGVDTDSLLWKQGSKNDYNDDVGTLQCGHFDIGTVRYVNNNNLSFYRLWKQVSTLVRVLDCGILRVEYNIRAYNIVCGMIHLGYVPSFVLAH